MPKRSLNSKNFEQLNLAIEAVLAQTPSPAAHSSAEIAPLIKIAAELRNLPHPNFKERLKTDLQRSTSMTTATESPAKTKTFAAPRITFKNAAKAIEFYEKAFGAKENFRFALGSSIPHAEIKIAGSVIFVTEEWPDGGRFSAETLGNSPIIMCLQVPDVDAFVAHAIAAGAKLVLPPSNQFYGSRDATVQDPFGYKWSISTIIEEMSVEEMHRRFNAATEQQKKPETPRSEK